MSFNDGNSTCNCSSGAVSESSSSSTIFSLPDLDFELATWCMISLIVFTILFETCLHRLEHSLSSHTHYLKILSKVYKELMILGFISFAILIILQVFPLGVSTTETLEFVHVWFFFIAVLYAIHVLVYMWLARRDKRRYDVAAYRRIPDLLEQHRATQTAAAALAEAKGPMASIQRFIRWGTKGSLGAVLSSLYQSPETSLYHQMQFHIVRSLFIRTYDLPQNFDFAKYLRRCMSKHITEQLDIKETSWLILIGLLVINVIRVELESYYGDVEYAVVTLWLFLVVPYFLLGLSFIAVLHIEAAKRALMAKVGVTNTDDLSPALLRSRAKTGTSRPAPVPQGKQGKRASVVLQDQQKALDAYLPLLLQGLFPYNRPTLFPKLLEMVMLCQCFFIGLACIFHIRQSFDTFSVTVASLYILFTMLPHLIVLLVIAPHVMTLYVFVHSVGYVNTTVLQHVTEYMHELETLQKEIQHYLQSYLHQEAITLPDLFLRLSKGSSTLPTPSLRSALHHIGVELTPSQTSRLVRLVNLGQDGHIDLREFTLFLLGSEGSAHLSLVPIRANTQAHLAMITERERGDIMESEARKAKERANTLTTPAGGEDAVIVVEADSVASVPGVAAPHTPVLHAGTPTSGSVPGPLSPHPLSPHQPLSPHSLPALDLRHVPTSKVNESNMFIAHTLDHSQADAHHHSHPHHHHHKKHHKVPVGRADVDALDFAACFHGAETACQRCGQAVLVRRINDHVKECRPRVGGAGVDGTLGVDGPRYRGGSMPDDGGEIAMMANPLVGKNGAGAVAMDDIVLNDSRGGSKRGTRTSGRALPVVVRGDGKVELFAVVEEGEGQVAGKKAGKAGEKKEQVTADDDSRRKRTVGRRRASHNSQ